MSRLDPVHGRRNDPGVVNRDLSVMVEVVHLTVAIAVDVDVRRISIHMAAEVRSAAGIAARVVVLRGPKAAHDLHAVGVDPMRLEIGENELELVDELCLKHEILWPDV